MPPNRVYEVFRQKRLGEEYVHVGEVEALDPETAMLAAKEHFSRRELCSGLWVVDREHVTAAHWDEAVLSSGFGKDYRKPEGFRAGTGEFAHRDLS
jgi:ring-1,2-phenylacetyl-CoA epoxidase subunit PaaB